MKVAVINTFDANDIAVWAGISKHICIMLDKIFKDDLVVVKMPPLKRTPGSLLRGFFYNRIKRKKYYTWADEKLIKKERRESQKTGIGKYDLIITFQFHLVPVLKNEKNKIIYWNDATFNNLIDFYEGYSNLSDYCLQDGNSIQKQAFSQTNFSIFSSDWAINSAIKDYQADATKLAKILFASNLNHCPSESEITPIIDSRNGPIVKLLFLGVDWQRKGGDAAVQVINKLNKNGIPAILYVVGTSLPDQYHQNECIIPLGFISKNSAEGEMKIINLLKECNFLVLPTIADCTPVVFSEAASYALPVITTLVGGTSSMIQNNVNGCYFEIENFVEKAAAFIGEHLPTTDAYNKLCYSSYSYYCREMSWEQVESKFEKILANL